VTTSNFYSFFVSFSLQLNYQGFIAAKIVFFN